MTYEPFAHSGLTPTADELVSYLGDLSPGDLTGPDGEFVLAIALTDHKEARKKARALLKRKGGRPQLQEHLKAHSREKLSFWGPAAVLESVIDGIDEPTLRYAVVRVAGSMRDVDGLDTVPDAQLRRWVAHGIAQQKKFEEYATVTLPGSWPAELLAPVLADLPESVGSLSFGVSSSTNLHVLALPDHLKILELRGAFTGFDALASVSSLIRLKVVGPSDLRSLSHPSLCGLMTEKTHGLPPFEAVPELVYLTMEGATVEGLVLAAPKLTSVTIRWGSCRNIDFGELPVLSKLTLYDCGLERLPASVGGLASLTELQLTRLPIDTLPAALSELTALESLHLMDLDLKELPVIDAEAPGHVGLSDTTLPERIPAATARFLKTPSTDVLVEKLAFFLEQYPDTPAAEALAAHRGGEPAASSSIREALLAVSRVHIDDEHGPTTNVFLCSEVGEHGSVVEQQANDVLPSKQVKGPSDVPKLAAKLEGVEGIDASAFVRMAEAMLEADAARGYRLG